MEPTVTPARSKIKSPAFGTIVPSQSRYRGLIVLIENTRELKTMLTFTTPSNPEAGAPRGVLHRCDESCLPNPAPLTDSQFAQIARGLAHPTRIAILRQLRNGQPRSAGEIIADTGLAQSTVSEHLRFLRDAQVLFTQKVGSRVWYCQRPAVLDQFSTAVADLAHE